MDSFSVQWEMYQGSGKTRHGRMAEERGERREEGVGARAAPYCAGQLSSLREDKQVGKDTGISGGGGGTAHEAGGGAGLSQYGGVSRQQVMHSAVVAGLGRRVGLEGGERVCGGVPGFSFLYFVLAPPGRPLPRLNTRILKKIMWRGGRGGVRQGVW